MMNNRLSTLFLAACLMIGRITLSAGQEMPPDYHESVYLHTDQEMYLTGDYVWMKAYLVDAFSLKPSELSKVIYVEILDADDRPVLQTKIKSANGLAKGSLFLPASLNSGYYNICAYTQWMRNDGAEKFFYKHIRIINPFKPLSPSGSKDSSGVDVQFFPEGGVMSSGLPARIAFRVVDTSGHGMPFRGLVISDQGDTVAHFSPLRYGMGNFRMTPASGRTYTAIIKNVLDSIITTSILPQTASGGMAMEVNPSDAGGWHLTVHSAYASTDQAIKINIRISRNGMTVFEQAETLRQKTTVIAIPDQHIAPGISKLTVFNEAQGTALERSVYRNADKRVSLDLTTSEQHFSQRERVDVTLASTVEEQPVAGSFSASVYLLDSLQGEDSFSIQHYFLLTSGLQGAVEDPEYYFSAGRNVIEARENLLMTQGWTRLSTLPREDSSYLPEFRTQIIRTRVKTSGNGRKEGIPVYLSLPGRHFKLQTAYTDPRGVALFEVRDFYGDQTIILQPDFRVDSTLTMEVLPAYSLKHHGPALPSLNINKGYKRALEHRSINMQMENIYFDQARARIVTDQLDTLPFYGHADQRYYLDDYTRFPSMLDVMKEYIQSVAVRKRKQEYHFMVYNVDTDRLFEENPLVLLDGVPVFSVNDMIMYDPLQVNYMDIVTHGYVLGPVSFDGIVSYSTYNGDLNGFVLPQEATVTEYSGYQWQREYFSPVYETADDRHSRLPDRRTLLCWSPDIVTDANGQATFHFYTSDIPGRYWLNVQGMDNEGHLGWNATVINVGDPASN